MIYPKRCPVCNVETNYIYTIEESDKKKATWYRCPCGVIFQEDFKYEYNKEDLSDTEENQKHAVHTYAPIIEELTYGRKMLQVDYESSPAVLDEFNKRGWIVWGIDEHEDNPHKNIYKGNILNYKFTPDIEDKELGKLLKNKKRKFNLIWMQHSIEHTKDPLKILKKTYDLLTDTGVLFITTPDIDFIHKQGIQYFPYWRRKENNVLFSERSLVREIKRIGFKVIMSRRNYAARFMGHFDVHLIAQKNYF